MNNYQYFEYSRKNPEKVFDPFYKKDGIIVIPKDNLGNNLLTTNNNLMIDCITAFKVLISKKHSIDDDTVMEIVKEIDNILYNTKNINYSAFSQFFMVYNSTYSYYKSLDDADRITFLYQMLLKYCNERHDIYISHGYTNAILQVMCDNYSHKRNGKSSIEKVLEILRPHNLQRIRDISLTDGNNYYFLPDKGDKNLFNDFLKKYNLEMKSREIEHDKLPDIVFNCNGEFYICELKTIKGNGGGQDKQMVELAHFISFTEKDSRFHYVDFLDGNYPNILFDSHQPKIVNHRRAIENALDKNKGNYFVNTAGFEKLVSDIFLIK